MDFLYCFCVELGFGVGEVVMGDVCYGCVV